MQTGQVQVRVSISPQLEELLKAKADRLGLPVAQLVKFLIVKEVENEEYPTYQASEQVEKNTKQALQQMDKAVDASDFFKQLNES